LSGQSSINCNKFRQAGALEAAGNDGESINDAGRFYGSVEKYGEENAAIARYGYEDYKSRGLNKGLMFTAKDTAKKLFDSHASDKFGDSFYNKVSEPVRQFYKDYGDMAKDAMYSDNKSVLSELKKDFRNNVAPELKELALDLEAVTLAYDTTTPEGRAELQAHVKKEFGIDAKQINEAITYIHWMSRSNWLEPSGLVGKVANNLSYHQASFNFNWALFNGGDLLRIVSPYIRKPDVLFKGAAKAFSKTEIDDLLLPMGFMDSSQHPRGLMEKLDPFKATNRVQQRLAYFLDKADGGDGLTGLRKNAFDREPWDAAPIEYHSNMGSDGSKVMFGLGRFLMSEFQYNTRNMINVLKVLKGTGDLGQAADYGIYNTLKAAMFGQVATPLALFYPLLNDDDKKQWREAGVMNNVLEAALNPAGIEAEGTLGRSFGPVDLMFGARAGQIANTAIFQAKGTADAVVKLTQGNLGEGVLSALIVSGSAAAMFAGRPIASSGKIADTAVDLFGNGQVQKMMKVWAKSMNEQWDDEKLKFELAQTVVGEKSIRKEDD
jgi:hypothetical protein